MVQGIRELSRYLRVFLIVFAGLLVMSAAAISFLGPKFVVYSAIRPALVLDGDKQAPIEPTGDIAKSISDWYLPLALAELEGRGVNEASLRPISGLKVLAGREYIILQSTVPTSSTSLAIGLQEKIFEKMREDRARQLAIAREGPRQRKELAEGLITSLAHQIDDLNAQRDKVIERQTASLNHLGSLLEDYSGKLKSPRVDVPDVDSTARELVQRIGAQEVISGAAGAEHARIGLEIIRLSELQQAQLRAVAKSQSELNAISETTLAERPTILPIPVGPGRFLLVLVAVPVCFLLAFGTVVLLQRLKNRSSGLVGQNENAAVTSADSPLGAG
jgi:hypothetical protein